MASIILAAAGTAIGGTVGGSILGVSAAAIGGAVGSIAGAAIDSWLVASMAPTQRIAGQRLDTLQITSSTEGAVIPRVFGAMRTGGNIIWATDFREETETTRQGGGGKGGGGGGGTEVTEYFYYASFAVALCEGPITGLGRIWADGKILSRDGITIRLHKGGEDQEPDPFIAAKMGAANTPAYRDTAYVLFEELPIERFGNRLPQLSFEVFRPILDGESAESLVRAVTLIPASGEFAYATDIVRREDGDGETAAENVNAEPDAADLTVALDRLEACAPKVESVSLVVAWFGDDLRAGDCRIRPGVEVSAKSTTPENWSVNGVARASAHLVSRDDQGRPAYGGTPADSAVVQAIRELKARGYRVTFYPFILMDVPSDNDLPDPYSDGASATGQPTYPWRGRITCSPAAGLAGSPDKTAAAGSQVTAFFGAAQPSDFDVDGERVLWDGDPDDWGLRRMILHYAHLCAAAGGVDAFLIGSELRGITQVRSGASTYPAVAALVDLAADVRSVLGSGTMLSYAADWSEYFGHHPQDGSGDVFFHLDPLWADDDIDFVGIDNYMPLADWRDGLDHLDAADFDAITDLDYLRGNVEGGEGFDWFYASAADRETQVRTPITDGAHGRPWVFRYKDLSNWWSNPHRNRSGGVESGSTTAWIPESKPIRFTEIGCPAVDRGPNQPNVFYDPKSAESFLPYFSRGWRDDAVQRRFLEAALGYWTEPSNNPISGVYSGRMIATAETAAWTWDARPYPAFPARSDVWTDADNWRLGHWLNGRLGSVSLGALVRELCRRAGLPDSQVDISALADVVHGYVVTAIESPRASIAPLARQFGFDAVESEGVIRFQPRDRRPVATLGLDDLAAASDADAEIIELVRAQETELPQALKWQLVRSDEEYDAMSVEARRATGAALRVTSETFAIATPAGDAERRCRRALLEEWVGRETASFRLPPSRLALDTGDVVRLDHDGRLAPLRLTSVADAGARAIEAVRTDASAYGLAPGFDRSPRVSRPVVYGPPAVAILDLPQLRDGTPAHQPLAAVHAVPWPGRIAAWTSPGEDGFSLATTLGRPARMGRLVSPLYPGPTSRFDLGNVAVVDLAFGTLASVPDLALLAGANALAIEAAPEVWEVMQTGVAELIAPGRYRLSRLLRGQRGTEGAIGSPAPAGARIVVLDEALVPLPVPEAGLGLEGNWRFGPASKPVADRSYRQLAFAPEGVGLRPFSVGHVRQPWRTARDPGDLVISWTRRSRALAADSWTAAEVPLAEDTEAYEVEVLDGSTVLRTLTTSTSSATYTAAQQLADLGALLGPGDTLDLRICQLSALTGRGAPASATLSF
ncbi:MAG: glycoside hydrolase TIM-barrel-like domain-containing protein [Rhodobacteraceae bacterium]|nr:glycoside hydrolase TIM-barrel-like domain-containing protein [Paracoccaceae bacterium]